MAPNGRSVVIPRGGQQFVVQSTVSDIERDLDPSYHWRRFDHDLSVERGPEQDRGHGHDR
jgi:hypothetical protein